MPQSVGLATALESVTDTNRAAGGAPSTVLSNFQASSSQTTAAGDRNVDELNGQENETEPMDNSEDERLSPRSTLEAYNERLVSFCSIDSLHMRVFLTFFWNALTKEHGKNSSGI